MSHFITTGFKRLLILSVYLSSQVFSSVPDTLWTLQLSTDFDMTIQSVERAGNSGFVSLISEKNETGNLADIIIVKVDAAKNILWSKVHGGEKRDEAYDMKMTIDSGFIIVGTSESYSDSLKEMWLLKVDSNGDSLWSKTFGDTMNTYGRSVTQTSDGGFAVLGTYGTMNRTTLMKTDSNGDSLWMKTLGWNLYDDGLRIYQTGDDGYIICGNTVTSTPTSDGWLVKTDGNGDTLWTRTYGRGGLYDYFEDVQQTDDAGYIVVGRARVNASFNSQPWILMMDSNGDTLWTKKFVGGPSSNAKVVKIALDSGFIIGGTFGIEQIVNDYVYGWVLKIDPQGDTLWTRFLEKNGFHPVDDIELTPKNGLIAGAFNWLVLYDADTSAITFPITQQSYNGGSFRILASNNHRVLRFVFDLPGAAPEELSIFTGAGKLVKRNLKRFERAEDCIFEWDITTVANGIYIYHLATGSGTVAGRLIVR